MTDVERFLRDGIQRGLDTAKDPRLDVIDRETLALFVVAAASGPFLEAFSEHFANQMIAMDQAKKASKQ